MAERCRWCGCGEMFSMTKNFEDGRTLSYRVCSHCGKTENAEGSRPTLAARGRASMEGSA